MSNEKRKPTIQEAAAVMLEMYRRDGIVCRNDAAEEIERTYGPTPLVSHLGDGGHELKIDERVIREFERQAGEGFWDDAGCWCKTPDDPGPDYPPPLPMEPLKGH